LPYEFIFWIALRLVLILYYYDVQQDN
jgi:hypothetical protein